MDPSAEKYQVKPLASRYSGGPPAPLWERAPSSSRPLGLWLGPCPYPQAPKGCCRESESQWLFQAQNRALCPPPQPSQYRATCGPVASLAVVPAVADLHHDWDVHPRHRAGYLRQGHGAAGTCRGGSGP